MTPHAGVATVRGVAYHRRRSMMKTPALIQRLVPRLHEDACFLVVDKPAGIDVGGLPKEGAAGLIELLAELRLHSALPSPSRAEHGRGGSVNQDTMSTSGGVGGRAPRGALLSDLIGSHIPLRTGGQDFARVDFRHCTARTRPLLNGTCGL
jgi:hypothetical protein